MAYSQLELPRRQRNDLTKPSFRAATARRRPPSSQRRDAEAMLRDIAFVLDCSRRLATSIRADKACPVAQ